MIAEYQDYFYYRWKNNKAHFLSSKSDEDIYAQLPSDVQRRIWSDFLLFEFLETYSRYFKQLKDMN